MSDEWFPLVDEKGNMRSVCHNGKSMLLHPVVHLHVFNEAGELYLQKRPMSKDVQPGKWDTSVGGHLGPGEDATTALCREAEEELGIKGFGYRFLYTYIWESKVEREYVTTYSAIITGMPAINRDEIDEGRFWTVDEIRPNLGKGIFTPNFEREFEMLSSNNIFPAPAQ
jgi:isopentenyldiphosphate isomerase